MRHVFGLAFPFLIGAFALAGCDSGGGNSGGQGGEGGEPGSGGTTTSSSSTGSSGAAGSGGAGGASGGFCPTANLGSAVPAIYDGTTVGKTNIATSLRLEWTDAGDDALLFVAPQTATYKVSMPIAPPGAACGASIREYGPQMNGMGEIYSSSWCPSQGGVKEIDGIFGAFAGGDTDIMLNAGQEMLVWVSCSYFSMPVEGAYRVMIDKL